MHPSLYTYVCVMTRCTRSGRSVDRTASLIDDSQSGGKEKRHRLYRIVVRAADRIEFGTLQVLL